MIVGIPNQHLLLRFFKPFELRYSVFIETPTLSGLLAMKNLMPLSMTVTAKPATAIVGTSVSWR